MTTLREAAKAVLEAWDNDGSTQTMEDLRNALEQSDMGIPITEKQAEPVATVQFINGITIGYIEVMQPVGTKLYTSPPQRKPLTDTLEALFTNIDHAISSGAWNVQTGSQTWEIIQEAKAAHGIGEKP